MFYNMSWKINLQKNQIQNAGKNDWVGAILMGWVEYIKQFNF